MNILPPFQNIKKGNYSKEKYIRVIEEQEETIRNLGYQICALQSKVEIMQSEARTIAEDAYAKGKEDGRREAEDEERPQGEWMKIEAPSYTIIRCTCCGYKDNAIYIPNYCPNCGAKMRGMEKT